MRRGKSRFSRAVILFFVALSMIGARPASAQDVPELIDHYSGHIDWNSETGTLTFATSGRVNFSRPLYRSIIWEVPAAVKRIVLERGVRVEAAFTITSSLDIEGQGEDQSEIFGTATPDLLHNAGLDGDGRCMPYSAVLATGRGVVVNISRLTSRDPIGFHFTGLYWDQPGAVMHLDHVSAIDDRGGALSHSDGIMAAKGSTVSHSYFATGDDVIKVYQDITVTDTAIKMILNAVPFQFGWGSYGSGARAVLRNVRVYGDSGRNQDFPIFNAQAGVYAKTVDAEGLVIDAPRATLFRFLEPQARLDISIRDARIDVGQYGPHSEAAGARIICGSQTPQVRYDCLTSSLPQ